MAYEPAVLRAASARLEAARTRRAEELARRRREIYQRLPQVEELDRQLKTTVLEAVRACIQRGGTAALDAAREKNLSLQAQRTQLLTSHGYPADALDERSECPLCGDTGWRGSEMCQCLRRLCAQEQIRELSKLLDLGEQSFDGFSLDYYSPLPDPDRGISPRKNMENIYELCVNYAQKFGRYYFNNLFLYGPPGLGKTFLSACIARTVAENGFSVVYDTAVNIFAQFEARKFARSQSDSQEARDETRRYLSCDLLILDDLGSELASPLVQTSLYTLLNTRLTTGKSTVVSSNLTMDDVRARYSPQIASRLEGEYRALPFFGQDIRLMRKNML